MKQDLLAFAVVCITSLAATKLNARGQSFPGTQEYKNNAAEFGKLIAPRKNYIRSTEPIGARELKLLTRRYKNIPVESWFKIKGGFNATLVSEGIRYTIFCDNNGEWTGSVKGYKEDKLSSEIKKTVKHNYKDHSIIYVEEVETAESNGVPVYLIHLEDKNSFKVVSFFEGHMKVKQEFEKN